MKLNHLIAFLLVLFVTFDTTESLFFGKRLRYRRRRKKPVVNPNNNDCYYDNQCSTGKCRRFDDYACGFGSKFDDRML